MNPKRQRPKLTRASAVLAGATGLALLCGELARHHWFFNLFPSFQIQYATLLLVSALGFLIAREWPAALIPAIVLIVPASRVVSLWSPAPPPPATPHLRVVAFNVLKKNRQHTEVVDWLSKTEADLLLLVETNQAWRQPLTALTTRYPYSVAEFDAGGSSFAFFSKYPISDSRVFTAGFRRTPLLQTTVATPGGPLLVFGAHPVPPVGPKFAAANDEYLTLLAKVAAATEGPAIILGDLNASRWSPAFTRLTSIPFEDSALGFGYQSTWHRRNPLLAIPIDHLLFRGLPRPQHREIGPDLGSDHRPLTVDFPGW